MKKIAFSFDDARLDTYEVAYPILRKYEFPFTINVVTDFVENSGGYNCFSGGGNLSMSFSALKECKDNGVEIACHGHKHLNTVDDINQNINVLQSRGLITIPVGFASPHSHLTEFNSDDIYSLVQNGTLSYVRSGIQTRREGFIYTALTLLCRIFKSKRLFWLLNKRNVIKDKNYKVLPSVAIIESTTLKQIDYFISKMSDGESVIFMFHSIIERKPAGIFKNVCDFTKGKFEKLVQNVKANSSCVVCTTEQIVKGE